MLSLKIRINNGEEEIVEVQKGELNSETFPTVVQSNEYVRTFEYNEIVQLLRILIKKNETLYF